MRSEVRLARGALAACALGVLPLIGLAAPAVARASSLQAQVRQAWSRFHLAYVDRDASALCTVLATNAELELEAAVGRDRCSAAAGAWFTSAEYDRAAALAPALLGSGWTGHPLKPPTQIRIVPPPSGSNGQALGAGLIRRARLGAGDRR